MNLKKILDGAFVADSAESIRAKLSDGTATEATKWLIEDYEEELAKVRFELESFGTSTEGMYSFWKEKEEGILKNIENCKKRIDDNRIVSELSEGFTLNDLEDYIYTNKREILDNMETYGVELSGVRELRNYYDVANILGVDSRLFKDFELSVATSYIYEVLSEDLDDSKADETSIVDLLWILQSAGVAYEKRKSMGVDKDEYREYILDLIKQNGLQDLVTDSVESVAYQHELFNTSMVEDVERETGFDVLSYDDFSIDVIDPNGSGGEDDRFRVDTTGKTLQEVCRAVLGSHIKDTSDPKVDLRDIVKQDFDESVEQDWSETDYAHYLHDVPMGFSTPQFLFKAEGAIDGSGDVVQDSPFVVAFLKHNDQVIKRLNDLWDNEEPEDMYQAFLHAYVTEFEDYVNQKRENE